MSTHPRSSEYARVLQENQRYVDHFDRSKLPMPPGRGLAIVACMDARITVEDVLGLRTGDAHIIRNAGGLITEDALRSLVISQQLLGTNEVLIIEHTDCGMLTFKDADVQKRLREQTGKDVDLPLLAFPDVDTNLRKQVDRVKAHPWLKPGTPVHGLVFEVATGRVREVVDDEIPAAA
jgi:carbonic anhydrase